jgi:hypothetical protein
MMEGTERSGAQEEEPATNDDNLFPDEGIS